VPSSRQQQRNAQSDSAQQHRQTRPDAISQPPDGDREQHRTHRVERHQETDLHLCCAGFQRKQRHHHAAATEGNVVEYDQDQREIYGHRRAVSVP